VLGGHHLLLERLGVLEHAVLVDRHLGRGEDVEVAVVEQPADEVDLEHRVVDLLEVGVGGPLVDDPLHLEQPAVGQDVLVRAPVPPSVHEEGDAGQDEDERPPADGRVEAVALVPPEHEQQSQQPQAPEEHREA